MQSIQSHPHFCVKLLLLEICIVFYTYNMTNKPNQSSIQTQLEQQQYHPVENNLILMEIRNDSSVNKKLQLKNIHLKGYLPIISNKHSVHTVTSTFLSQTFIFGILYSILHLQNDINVKLVNNPSSVGRGPISSFIADFD